MASLLRSSLPLHSSQLHVGRPSYGRLPDGRVVAGDGQAVVPQPSQVSMSAYRSPPCASLQSSPGRSAWTSNIIDPFSSDVSHIKSWPAWVFRQAFISDRLLRKHTCRQSGCARRQAAPPGSSSAHCSEARWESRTRCCRQGSAARWSPVRELADLRWPAQDLQAASHKSSTACTAQGTPCEADRHASQLTQNPSPEGEQHEVSTRARDGCELRTQSMHVVNAMDILHVATCMHE